VAAGKAGQRKRNRKNSTPERHHPTSPCGSGRAASIKADNGTSPLHAASTAARGAMPSTVAAAIASASASARSALVSTTTEAPAICCRTMSPTSGSCRLWPTSVTSTATTTALSAKARSSKPTCAMRCGSETPLASITSRSGHAVPDRNSASLPGGAKAGAAAQNHTTAMCLSAYSVVTEVELSWHRRIGLRF